MQQSACSTRNKPGDTRSLEWVQPTPETGTLYWQVQQALMKNLFCDVFVGGLTLTHRKLQMDKNGLT